MQHGAGFVALCEAARKEVVEVSVEQAATADGVIVDVREDHEWQQGFVKGAVDMGRGIIERDIEKRYPDKQQALYLYCGGGYRSALSAVNLQLMGYSQVYSIAGGYKAWVKAGLPCEQA